ncbi:hypothetical protein LXL04_007764 [Taraxacum kok-saghyz]
MKTLNAKSWRSTANWVGSRQRSASVCAVRVEASAGDEERSEIYTSRCRVRVISLPREEEELDRVPLSRFLLVFKNYNEGGK